MSPPADHAVMPAQAGIHDYLQRTLVVETKSWVPAFAGMTGLGGRGLRLRVLA